MAEIAAAGRLRTSAAAGSLRGGGSSDGASASSLVVEWEERLCFRVPPSPRAQHLKLVLYRPAPAAGAQHEYVACGSQGLDHLLAAQEQHAGQPQQQEPPACEQPQPPRPHTLSVPVVDEVGKHAGAVHCTLHIAAGGAAAGQQASDEARPATPG